MMSLPGSSIGIDTRAKRAREDCQFASLVIATVRLMETEPRRLTLLSGFPGYRIVPREGLRPLRAV